MDTKRHFVDRPRGRLYLFLAVIISMIVVVVGIEVIEARAETRAPAVEQNCGYISCTLYFNASETQRIASGGVSGAGVAAVCAKYGLAALVACEFASAWWTWSATSARSQDKCLKMTWRIVTFGGVLAWPGSYTCGTRPWYSAPSSNGGGGGGFGAG